MINFSTQVDGFWIFINYVLPIAFGLAALFLSILRPGKNAQAIRAIAVVTLFTLRFWLGAAGLAWALVDIFFPNAKISIPSVKKDKEKK